MAMSMQNMQMERARLAEEQRMHDMENVHFLQQQANTAKALAQTHEYQIAEMKNMQAERELRQSQAAAGQVTSTLTGMKSGDVPIPTSVQPTPDTGANDLQFAQNAANTPAPQNAPIDLPTMPGVSPADQTQQTINQAPTSAGAISGNGPQIGPQLPVAPPIPQGAAPVTNQMAPGQDIKLSLGGIIPASQAAAIQPNPSWTQQKEIEQKNTLATKAVEQQGRMEEEKAREAAALTRTTMEVNAQLQNAAATRALTKVSLDRQQNQYDRAGLETALKFTEEPLKDKYLGITLPLYSILKDNSDAVMSGKPISGMRAVMWADAVSKGVTGVALPNLTNFTELEKKTNSSVANLVKAIKGIKDPNAVVFDAGQLRDMVDTSKGIMKTTLARLDEVDKTAYQKAHDVAPNVVDPQWWDQREPYSGLTKRNRTPQGLTPAQ
jgi:hypothetical protein